MLYECVIKCITLAHRVCFFLRLFSSTFIIVARVLTIAGGYGGGVGNGVVTPGVDSEVY